MNLEEKMTQTLQDKMNDGTVEKLVAEKTEEAIKSALDDVFGWSGAGKKVLEEKIKSVMVPYLESYDYSKYIVKLDDVMTEVLKETTKDNREILDNFQKLVKTDCNKKEIKSSEIFEEYMEYVEKNVDTSELEVDFDGYPSYEYVTISMKFETLDERSWSSFSYGKIILECEQDEAMNIEIPVSKYLNSAYDTENWRLEPIKTSMDISSLRNIDSFSLFLMNLKQNNVHIIIDSEWEEDEVRPEEEPEPSW